MIYCSPHLRPFISRIVWHVGRPKTNTMSAQYFALPVFVYQGLRVVEPKLVSALSLACGKSVVEMLRSRGWIYRDV